MPPKNRPAGRSRRLDLKEQLKAAEWLFRRPAPAWTPPPAGQGTGAYGQSRADPLGLPGHDRGGWGSGKDEDGTEGGGS